MYHYKRQHQLSKQSSIRDARLRSHIASSDPDRLEALTFHTHPKPHGRFEAHRLYLYSNLPVQVREEQDFRTKNGLRIVGGYNSLACLATIAQCSLSELGRRYGARTN